MSPRRPFVVLPLLLALVAATGQTQEWEPFALRDGSQLDVQADSIAVTEGGARLQAEGGVVLEWKGYRLSAAEVDYRRATETVAVTGDVVLEDPEGNVLRCRRMLLDLVDQTGEVEEGSLWMAGEGYRVWGRRMRKTGPVTYEVEDGGFTACDGTWPSWRVEADRVRVAVEGYLVGRGAAFWVEGAPVAYTPYILLPAKTQRQSGFLMPKIGYSDGDGIVLGTRYYWAFADNADATLGVEYRSRRGWTESAEIRYVLAEGHEGSAAGTYLKDRKEDSRRYTVKADHRSDFGPGTLGRLHVDYLGDDDYLKDTGDTLDERGVERLESYLLLERATGLGSWFGFANYFEALTEDQAGVLQTLPSAGLLSREVPLAGPFFWDPWVQATRFWRSEGERGERLEVWPGLGVEADLGPLGFAARARYRENVYRLDGEALSRGAAGGEASTSLSLARNWGSLVHAVEPSLRLFWEEDGRGDDAPAFDDADRFGQNVQLAARLTSSLLREPDYASVLDADLEWLFDVEKAESGPLRAAATLTPGPRFRAGGEVVYDPDADDPLVRWSGLAEASDRRGDRVFCSYRFVDGSAGYADGGAEVALTRVLSLQYRHRYSVRDEQTLEQAVGAHLRHPCWEVLLTVSRLHEEETGGYDHRYFLTMNLKGLGTIGSLRGVLP